MISIIQHIQYLILTQDCVIVPGLGAFVAQYEPASFSPDGLTLMPPSRQLSFNASLTHDDAMLACSVTRREGVSYECAKSAVEQEVELIQRRLRNEGELSLPRIGTLRLTPHQTIEFTPDAKQCVATLPFAGFRTLAMSPLASVKPATPITLTLPESAAATNSLSETEEHTPAKKRRIMAMPALKYAASAAVLIGACITLLTPVNPTGFELASLQPSRPVATQTEETIFPEPDQSRFADCKITLYQPDPKEATATVSPRMRAEQQSYGAGTETHRYYLIVASASSMKEARRYVRMHSTSATPLMILPSGGRYRVYAASGNDFDHISSLRTASADFAAKNPNAWVYTLKK